jgi:hypothetical protein
MRIKRSLRNCLFSAIGGGVVSHATVALRSRAEQGRADLPMHAVSHMVWGDPPQAHQGKHAYNEAMGTALHHGACVFWAVMFESLFGKRAERSTSSALVGGATTAAAAYIIDYHVVADRLNPGFHAHLSPRSVFLVYAGLAVGLAAGARLRGLYDHQIEDRDERDERRPAERRPDPVVAPEERR